MHWSDQNHHCAPVYSGGKAGPSIGCSSLAELPQFLHELSLPAWLGPVDEKIMS